MPSSTLAGVRGQVPAARRAGVAARLACQWQQLGLRYDPEDAGDAAAMALAIEITRGNYRLIERLFAQVHPSINHLRQIANGVVKTAREGRGFGVSAGCDVPPGEGPERPSQAGG